MNVKVLEVRRFKPGIMLGLWCGGFSHSEWIIPDPYCRLVPDRYGRLRPYELSPNDYDVVYVKSGWFNTRGDSFGGQKPIDHLTFSGIMYIPPDLDFVDDVSVDYKDRIYSRGATESDTCRYSSVNYTINGVRYSIPGSCLSQGNDAECLRRESAMRISYSTTDNGGYWHYKSVDQLLSYELQRDRNGNWILAATGERSSKNYASYGKRFVRGYGPEEFKSYYVPKLLGTTRSSDAQYIFDFEEIEPCIEPPPSVPPETYTDLLNNLKFKPNINNLENLSGLDQMRSLIPDVLKLLKGRVNTKLLADSYLLYNYGINTLKMDVLEAADRLLKSRPNSNVSSAVNLGIDGWRIRCSIYGASNPYSILDELGLSINLTNLWDMVPYSFVIDWFTNIGTVLESIDTAETVRQTHISAYLVSYSRVTTVRSPNLVGCGFAKRYIRRVAPTIPQEFVSFDLATPHPQHYLAGGALLKSRGKI